jgi:hypothetical protein
MSNSDQKMIVEVNTTKASCPIGETIGKRNISQSKIPVLSCEGACIRGEIARLAANIVSKEQAYGRGCHGELITVPESAIAQWTKSAEKNILDNEKLIQFDALSHHKKYNDIFDYEDVPEEERKEVAQSVADWVMDSLNNPSARSASSCGSSSDLCSASCG